jgi:predicted MFS family arabinose efflux permease
MIWQSLQIRERHLEYFFTSIGLAMVSGPLITSLFLGFLVLNSFFIFLSLFPAASFIIYLVGAREKDSQIEKYAGIDKSNSLWRVLRHNRVLGLCVCRVLFSITSSIFATVFSVYARDLLLFTESAVSVLFLIRGGANALLRLPSGKISDIVGRRTPIFLSYILVVTVFFLISEISDFIGLALIMMIYGCAWGYELLQKQRY